ncbi:MAG: UDP-N-acetylglucosamine 2-epimerase, partial [Gaiellales bacterium]
MLDASLLLTPVALERATIVGELDLADRGYAVLTLHRQGNVLPEALGDIVHAINGLDLPVVFPIHPRTRKACEAQGLELGPHVTVTAPLGYLDFTALLAASRVVLTDSGGVQKEAYWHRVPCVTLRNATEWPETVAAGWNRLAGSDAERIAGAVDGARAPIDHPDLYGDGRAAEAIATHLATMSAP